MSFKKYNQNVNEQEALDNFVEKIDKLTINEVSKWRETQFQVSKGQKSLNYVSINLK